MNTSLILSSPLPLDQNAAAVYIASLPARSGQRTQAQALRVVASILNTEPNTLNWGALRYRHTAMIRSQLMQSYAPASANKILSALRQTLKQAWLLGQMTAEEYSRATELEPVTGETLPAGRELSTGEIRALLDTCRADTNTTAGARDAAIIALMYTAGPRREEVVNLNLSDYEPSTGKLIITGKRSKQRTAYIINGAAKALDEWLSIRGSTPGAIFVEVNKSGRLGTNTLTPQAIYNMLAKRASEAGLQNFSPHDLRRTFISHLLDAGADISTVSKMAGHSNVQTTARYDRRPEDAKRNAASLLHIP
jgi:site-specific recombinase XerD